MCGRYTLTTDQRTLEERFGFRAPGLALAPRYNIAPTQPVLALVREGLEREARMFRWGLIPHWAREAPKSALINARAETVGERPAFRDAFRRRRCLVLADGFYEWRRSDGRRRPFRVVLRSREPFAFAGLWDLWQSPAEGPLLSCTIITTVANPLVAHIHDRMPVILSTEGEDLWLDPSADPGDLRSLLTPYPSEEMEMYPVPALVNSVRNDDLRCIQPVM